MSNLRVISGSARGFHLRSVPGDSTRPITDQVKEALFNILGGDIVGSSFLDLFGGTGCVGIEALSRGAAYSRFIDNNARAIQTIRSNLLHTGLQEKGGVIHNDAFSYLSKKADRPFDYIFIAPPQYKGMWSEALTTLDAHPEWLSEDSWVIVQIHPVEYQVINLIHLDEFDQRRYGSTLLIFYRAPETQ